MAINVVNGLIFYAGWYLCLAGGAMEYSMWPIVTTWILIAIQLGWTGWYDQLTFKKDLVLVVGTTVMGILLEILYINMGVIQYTIPNHLWNSFPPDWIIPLYALVGLSLNHSLLWLQDRFILAGVLGSGCAVLSTLAGTKSGSAELPLPYHLSLIFIGFCWFFILPLILGAAKRLRTE